MIKKVILLLAASVSATPCEASYFVGHLTGVINNGGELYLNDSGQFVWNKSFGGKSTSLDFSFYSFDPSAKVGYNLGNYGISTISLGAPFGWNGEASLARSNDPAKFPENYGVGFGILGAGTISGFMNFEDDAFLVYRRFNIYMKDAILTKPGAAYVSIVFERTSKANGKREFMFANINVNGGWIAGTPAPEPTTWSMLITGFAMIGSRLRSRAIRRSERLSHPSTNAFYTEDSFARVTAK